MKAIILAAGIGKRIEKAYGEIHKTLIPVLGRPVISYLIENLFFCNVDELILVAGYRSEEVIEFVKSISRIPVIEIVNSQFDKFNNLYSLMLAEQYLYNEDFIEINGDAILERDILKGLSNCEGAAIAVAMKNEEYIPDSPAVCINGKKITDLGRHIERLNADAYAIGAYKFSASLSKDFFDISHVLIETDPQMGFHEPLRSLFETHCIRPYDVGKRLWMDIDNKEDVSMAEKYLLQMGYSCK